MYETELIVLSTNVDLFICNLAVACVGLFLNYLDVLDDVTVAVIWLSRLPNRVYVLLLARH